MSRKQPSGQIRPRDLVRVAVRGGEVISPKPLGNKLIECLKKWVRDTEVLVLTCHCNNITIIRDLNETSWYCGCCDKEVVLAETEAATT
jgi:hypothetical protein